MNHYPSWRYHKKLEPKLVKSEKESASLSNEWKHSPAEFDVAGEESKEDLDAVDVASAKQKPKKKGAA